MSDEVLALPGKYADYSMGFSLDSGGSVIKVIYRSKEDYEHGKPRMDTGGKTLLRFRYFNREDYEQVIEFLRSECDIIRDEGATAIHTGVGLQHFSGQLEQAFHSRVVCASEFDGASIAITTLVKHMAHDDVFEPTSVVAMANMIKRLIMFLPLMGTMRNEGGDEGSLVAQKLNKQEIERGQKIQEGIQKIMANPDPVQIAVHFLDDVDVFPCYCVVCGSAFASMVFEEDRSTSMGDMSTRGGRMFLGLGRALCGAKSYDELVEMAVKGDKSKVDVQTEDLKSQDNTSGDLYAKMPDGISIFSFGRLHEEKYDGTYTKDDIAASILHTVVMDMVSASVLNAVYRRLRSVVFVGSFLTHPHVREVVWDCFLERTGWLPPDEKPVLRITKHPGHIITAGAYISGWEKQHGKDE